MAYIRIKNNRYHIVWYDRALKKNRTLSTGLKATKRNKAKANQIAKEFETSLAEKYKTVSTEFGGGLNSTIDKAIAHFYEVNQNKNRKTILGYKHFFDKFLDGDHFKKIDHVCIITKRNVESWILSIDTERYQQNTLYGITKNLNKFLNFLFEYGYIPFFKINKDLKFKPETKEIVTFSEDDVELILNNLKQRSRNLQVSILLLIYTGLRPSDIINIERKDIDLTEGILKYYSQKTRKYFTVPLTEELVKKIEPLIGTLGPTERIIEFKNYQILTREINKYLKRLNLKEKGYNARTFRKTFVSLAFKSHVDYVTTSELVGHSNISTTKKYYTKLSMEQKREEINKIKFPSSKESSKEGN